MVIREDVDIGSVVVDNLHMRSECVQLRLEKVVDALVRLRRIQLGLFYCGLGLEEPTDDIADDVPLTRILLNKYTKPTEFVGIYNRKESMGEVHEV